MKKQKVKSIGIAFFTFAFYLFPFAFDSFAASGCNYPTSLDSYTNKVTGDYLTTSDINSRSCAIEQLEIRLNQLLTGKTGGQTLTGDTAVSGSLILQSTSNATKGKIFLGVSGLSAFDEAAGKLGIGTVVPTRSLQVLTTNAVNTMLLQVNTDTTGPIIETFHNTSSSHVGEWRLQAIDSGSAVRTINQIYGWYLDATAASQDSEIRFCVQNNVNAGNCNMVASLSSLGVWTNASSAAFKDYEGDIPGGAIDNLKKLTTVGVYRAKGLPPGKVKNAERHYSPTAEDFYKATGLGRDTGIAASDAAFIAAKAVLELEARVQALEKKVP